MKTTQRKRLVWLEVFAELIALATGLWLARGRGWLDPGLGRAGRLMHEGREGMDMNMPGMDMGSMQTAPADKPSEISDRAEVTIPREFQQRIGITVGAVEEAPLHMSVRTLGIVRPEETNIAHIHLRTEGWIEEVFVNFTGKRVNNGDPLLAIYSPDFLTTQREYLSALRGQPELAKFARRRLEFWGVSAEEIRPSSQ